MVESVKEFGLIGHPLGHSISPRIHTCLDETITYRLFDMEESELSNFFKTTKLDGFNVTIPYKETVLSYLDEVSQSVKEIGACNTVVRKHDKWVGTNTDVLGFLAMLDYYQVPSGICYAILGSGGASKAVCYALKSRNIPYQVVSRTKKTGCITYEEFYEKQSEFTGVVNTTPCGMYPNLENEPLDLEKCTKLQVVIDVIANPLQTRLVQKAKQKGCLAFGGLYMLVAQAFFAENVFQERMLDAIRLNKVYKAMRQENENLVLIGLPGCGKSTLGKALAEQVGYEFVDMDEWIELKNQISIPSFIKKHGETSFRQLELEAAKQLVNKHRIILSSGGGVVETKETMEYLKANGKVVYIEKNWQDCMVSSSRPLSDTKEKLEQLKKHREVLYRNFADVIIDGNRNIDDCLEQLQAILKG